MSLDLKDERIIAVITLPVPALEPGYKCRLIEAHGRLVVAAIVRRPTNTKTEVGSMHQLMSIVYLLLH
ncbi:hypothetical protein E2562_031644 [Oryza meyeriana var. granulata]|uniref:Uncharacterized protein n=1 Tax=Oryza meyeriana var. granulata TaxID=110450 RepID=A0A6G1DA29_9ORYZ|nr:hypothetical protein E2562_031644 [Oryza meyeriana var. granulata]